MARLPSVYLVVGLLAGLHKNLQVDVAEIFSEYTLVYRAAVIDGDVVWVAPQTHSGLSV